MGNNGFENFCNCENNESKLEASFRTSPNQNNPSSDRILCPFVHTVIYQNYTLDNKKNKKLKNKNNKKFITNNYEMNFEYHSTQKNSGRNLNKYKNGKGIFNLNPINAESSEDKKSSKSNENNNGIYNNDMLEYNNNEINEIIDNKSNKEENEENDEKSEKEEKEENVEAKNLNENIEVVENLELNQKSKNIKSHYSSENFDNNSDAPTTNIDKTK